MKQLGNSCADLVRDAGQLQADPTDTYTKRHLSEHGQRVLENVSDLESMLKFKYSIYVFTLLSNRVLD